MVPHKAKACPECGACEETGWSDDARADQLGIPSENFDYDDYVKREFEGEKAKPNNRAMWIVTAIVLLAIFLWAALGPHMRR